MYYMYIASMCKYWWVWMKKTRTSFFWMSVEYGSFSSLKTLLSWFSFRKCVQLSTENTRGPFLNKCSLKCEIKTHALQVWKFLCLLLHDFFHIIVGRLSRMSKVEYMYSKIDSWFIAPKWGVWDGFIITICSVKFWCYEGVWQ